MKLRLTYLKTPRAHRGAAVGAMFARVGADYAPTSTAGWSDMLIVMPSAGGKACARLRGGSTRQRKRALRLLQYGIAQGWHAPDRKSLIGRLSRFC